MQAAKKLREPLLANLRRFIQSGDQLANQPPSQDPVALSATEKPTGYAYGPVQAELGRAVAAQ